MVNLIRKYSFYLLALLLATALAGCGSGSGTTSTRTTKAKTSVKTAGLVSSGLLVGALEVVIAIPYGVTVEVDPVTSQPAKSVVQLVGTAEPAMTLNALSYTAATQDAKGSLRIVYLNAAGFTPSDSISVQLDIAQNFFPKASDFSLTKFEITTMSADGSTINSPIPVTNPTFSVEVI